MKHLNISRENLIRLRQGIKNHPNYNNVMEKTPVYSLDAHYDNSNLYVNLQGCPMIVIITTGNKINIGNIRRQNWLTYQKGRNVIMVNFGDSKIWDMTSNIPFIDYIGNSNPAFKTIEVVSFNKHKIKCSVSNRSDNISIDKDELILSSSDKYIDGSEKGTVEINDKRGITNIELGKRSIKKKRILDRFDINNARSDYIIEPRLDGIKAYEGKSDLVDSDGNIYNGLYNYYPLKGTFFANNNSDERQLFSVKDIKMSNKNGNY